MNNPFDVIDSRLSNIENLLISIKHNQPAPAVMPVDRCNVHEAEKITGLKKPTIYKLCFAGKLPYQKFGKFLVFSRKELEQWMSDQTKPGIKETASKVLTDGARKRM